jgi:hypothetical protein
MFCDADTDTTDVTEQVVLMVVVEAEVAPILEELQFVEDQATTDELLGLARVRSGPYRTASGSIKLSVLKVAESAIFRSVLTEIYLCHAPVLITKLMSSRSPSRPSSGVTTLATRRPRPSQRWPRGCCSPRW